MLNQVVYFLAAAVILVPIFQKLGFGSVFGYLVAGILLGPYGVKLVSDSHQILEVSEYGIVFLLFIIGLELQPSRLWILRKQVFGLGGSQVGLGTLVMFCCFKVMAYYLEINQNDLFFFIVAFAFSMSSTALVIQTLADNQELSHEHGRKSFAILLFQDIAAIPFLTIMPFLAESSRSQMAVDYGSILNALLAIVGLILLSKFVLRHVFKYIASLKNRDIFTAVALLIVAATAVWMHYVGLSMALGAFISGVMLSESEYKHELEAVIEPFKGLLLGLFFIAIGLTANLSVLENPFYVKIVVISLMIIFVVKFTTIFLLGLIAKSKVSSARKLGIYLSPGGEFAFVIFALGSQYHFINDSALGVVQLIVIFSFLIGPIFYFIERKLIAPRFDPQIKPQYDTFEIEGAPIVIAGFGRFGQIIARILSTRKMTYTVLEKSAEQVDFVRKFGNKVYFGDASKLELLRSARVDKCKLFVLAIDDVEASLKSAELVKKHFPNVKIFARARNRFHAYKLLDLGIKVFYRETMLSSLAMAKDVLIEMGLDSIKAETTIKKFQEYDDQYLLKQHAIYKDEKLLIQTAKQAISDLENLFSADSEEITPNIAEESTNPLV